MHYINDYLHAKTSFHFISVNLFYVSVQLQGDCFARLVSPIVSLDFIFYSSDKIMEIFTDYLDYHSNCIGEKDFGGKIGTGKA